MDPIDRQTAIEEIKAIYEYHDTVTEDRIIDHLKRLPSTQSEVTEEEVKEYCRKRCLSIIDSALLKKYVSAQPEIIRCGDCKHWGKRGLCDKWDYYISNGDFYCGCAERREG